MIQLKLRKFAVIRKGIKLSQTVHITGIVNWVLKPSKVLKQPTLRVNNTQAIIPTLLYGTGTWTLKEQDKTRITAAEMTLLEKLQKHTLRQQKESRYHNGNQNTTSFGKKVNNYKNKWIQYVCRMDRSRLPNAIMKHHIRMHPVC
jgi:hypothetical protein